MPHTLNYFNDTIGANAELTIEATAPHRILYMHKGSATINGESVDEDSAVYANGKATIQAGPNGARIFRWEILEGKPDLPDNVESLLRMSREIWSVDTAPGTDWIFRLDRIQHPGMDPADAHTHPGPGIRAILAGRFIIQQTSESTTADLPGDPFWETGIETVISTPNDPEQDTIFLRGMLLPLEFEGRPDTAKWLRAKPKMKSDWKLYVDQQIKF